jgi:hypothetical protein
MLIFAGSAQPIAIRTDAGGSDLGSVLKALDLNPAFDVENANQLVVRSSAELLSTRAESS